MKHLIRIFFSIISFVALFSCKKDISTSKILINFINITGTQIENATADSIGVGTIANNGQTGFISFDKFGTDTNMPDCDFTGIFNNDTLKSTSKFYWCGTEKSKLRPGKYTVEVKIYKSGVEKYFDLRFK
jgi:hypothetical protein